MSTLDPGLSQLFQAHVNVVNSERSTIWQRYSAMLIANPLLLSLQKSGPMPVPVVIAVLGILLCGIWFGMTLYGWRAFYNSGANAWKFPLGADFDRMNPFRSRRQEDYQLTLTRCMDDHILLCAFSTIILFGVMYAVLFIASFLSH